MSALSDTSPPAEWYLARDGQQFGPLSDPELKKLVEFGHLKPNDLIWREGFPEWRPAQVLLSNTQVAASLQPTPPPAPVPVPPVQAPAPAPQQPIYANPMPAPGSQPASPRHAAPPQQAAAPARSAGPAAPQSSAAAKGRGAPKRPDPRDEFDDEDDDEARPSGLRRAGLWLKRAAVLIFFASTLSAAAWYTYPYRDRIMSIASSVSPIGGDRSLAVSPVAGFAETPEATDLVLQKAKLWQVLKRDFPEWYGARLKEAADLAQAKKADAAIGDHMIKAVSALRRQYAGDALSATAPRLKAIAASFAENLVRLKGVSTDACYGSISTGESSAAYVQLLADPAHIAALQGQIVTVFEAISEGRKLPRVYPAPRQADYNTLVTELETRGWTNADLRLFSDSQALAKAAPDKVCQMVTDWFQAQLVIKDPDMQLRLLVDALRPVVTG